MAYHVITTAPAERDFWRCYGYISDRSAAGAASWRKAFEEALLSLEASPMRGIAPESVGAAEEIRQRMFKTRKGSWYRLLFVVRDDKVFVLHVRGPGQDAMRDDDIELPGGDE